MPLLLYPSKTIIEFATVSQKMVETNSETQTPFTYQMGVFTDEYDKQQSCIYINHTNWTFVIARVLSMGDEFLKLHTALQESSSYLLTVHSQEHLRIKVKDGMVLFRSSTIGGSMFNTVAKEEVGDLFLQIHDDIVSQK